MKTNSTGIKYFPINLQKKTMVYSGSQPTINFSPPIKTNSTVTNTTKYEIVKIKKDNSNVKEPLNKSANISKKQLPKYGNIEDEYNNSKNSLYKKLGKLPPTGGQGIGQSTSGIGQDYLYESLSKKYTKDSITGLGIVGGLNDSKTNMNLTNRGTSFNAPTQNPNTNSSTSNFKYNENYFGGGGQGSHSNNATRNQSYIMNKQATPVINSSKGSVMMKKLDKPPTSMKLNDFNFNQVTKDGTVMMTNSNNNKEGIRPSSKLAKIAETSIKGNNDYKQGGMLTGDRDRERESGQGNQSNQSNQEKFEITIKSSMTKNYNFNPNSFTTSNTKEFPSIKKDQTSNSNNITNNPQSNNTNPQTGDGEDLINSPENIITKNIPEHQMGKKSIKHYHQKSLSDNANVESIIYNKKKESFTLELDKADEDHIESLTSIAQMKATLTLANALLALEEQVEQNQIERNINTLLNTVFLLETDTYEPFYKLSKLGLNKYLNKLLKYYAMLVMLIKFGILEFLLNNILQKKIKTILKVFNICLYDFLYSTLTSRLKVYNKSKFLNQRRQRPSNAPR